MGKLLSINEKRLQKKLIPLNIFVCILCLIASISLMFAPIFKLDVGKVMRSESVKSVVEKMLDENIGGSLEGSSQEGINFAPVVGTVVNKVLGSAKGSLTISSFGAAKVAFSKGDSKSDAVLQELFFGKNALVTQLVTSTVEAVSELFETDEGKELIEDVVVKALADNVVGQIEGVDLSAEDINTLVGKFKEIEKVSDGDVTNVVNDFVDELETIAGSDVNITEADRETIINEVQKMYDDTYAELAPGESVTVESIICVAVSKNVDLGEINIGNIIGNINGGGENPGETVPESSVSLADEELTPGEGDGEQSDEEAPGEGDGEQSGEETPGEGEQPGEEIPDEQPGEQPEQPDDNTGGGNQTPGEQPDDTNRVIVTTYTDLMKEIGFDDNLTQTLSEKLGTMVSEMLGEMSDYFDYYGYLFYGMLIFIVPWVILFLFSFFHMLAKNKRFVMWYVKLYSFIPGLISLAIILFPTLKDKIPFLAELFKGENGELINEVIGGFSSMLWISGICYVLLWLVSIFWAFPIKHKIRKERKLCKAAMKSGTYSYDTQPSAGGYGTDSYGSGYGSDSFGSGYDSYGLDSGFDDDYDFGSDYGSGSFGSSSIFDDDDDDLF